MKEGISNLDWDKAFSAYNEFGINEEKRGTIINNLVPQPLKESEKFLEGKVRVLVAKLEELKEKEGKLRPYYERSFKVFKNVLKSFEEGRKKSRLRNKN